VGKQEHVLEREHRIAELAETLKMHGIDVLAWGKGKAKTVEQLYNEIAVGETQLIEGADQALFREVIVAKGEVTYLDAAGVTHRLIEQKQVFTDGRKRTRELDTAISEKMKFGENPDESIIRGVEEELGISGPITATSDVVREQLEDSPSYPGLQTRYRLHYYRIVLDSSQYRLDGYVEKQPDKSTFFTWQRSEPKERS